MCAKSYMFEILQEYKSNMSKSGKPMGSRYLKTKLINASGPILTSKKVAWHSLIIESLFYHITDSSIEFTAIDQFSDSSMSVMFLAKKIMFGLKRI